LSIILALTIWLRPGLDLSTKIVHLIFAVPWLGLVTRKFVFKVTTWEECVVQLDHAVTAILATSHPLTRVVAMTVEMLTGLGAGENPMHALKMASSFTAVTTVIKIPIAHDSHLSKFPLEMPYSFVNVGFDVIDDGLRKEPDQVDRDGG